MTIGADVLPLGRPSLMRSLLAGTKFPGSSPWPRVIFANRLLRSTIRSATTSCRLRARHKAVERADRRRLHREVADCGFDLCGLDRFGSESAISRRAAGRLLLGTATGRSQPDVVFEGGNIGVDPASGFGDHVDDLALLTTYRNIGERPFTTIGDTSAATALGARMAVRIRPSSHFVARNGSRPDRPFCGVDAGDDRLSRHDHSGVPRASQWLRGAVAGACDLQSRQ